MSEKKQKNGREKTQDGANTNKPIHEMRMANVRATIWENGGWCSVTFSRLYLPEGQKQWNSTTSFRRTDMGNLALLAFKAEQWMATRLEAENASADELGKSAESLA